MGSHSVDDDKYRHNRHKGQKQTKKGKLLHYAGSKFPSVYFVFLC